jgi:transposase
MKTKDACFLSPVVQEDLRRKGIKSILDGKKQVEAAELFGVTRQPIEKWLKACRCDS